MAAQRTIAQVFAIVTLVAIIGIPNRHAIRSCPPTLTNLAYTLRGTGVEETKQWALFSLQNSQEELVGPGDELEGCFTVVNISTRSATLRLQGSNELRTFYLSGHSAKGVESNSQEPSSGFMRAMTGFTSSAISPEVEKITYPDHSDNNTLPQAIYVNKKGDSLYRDLNALGLGEDAVAESDTSTQRGVQIGTNSEGSLLGSIGLRQGDHIVAINGNFVTTPQEVAAFIKAAGDRPIQISYSDASSEGILSTAAMIKGG